MKKLFYVPLFILLVLAGMGAWFYSVVKPISSTKEFTSFVINKGQSAGQVAQNLEKSGIIRSALAFKIYLQFTNQAGNIQTGEFRLSSGLTLFEVVEALQKGPLELWVTIPEGLRREEVAVKFAQTLGKDQTFINEFLDLTEGMEGMLFPDTYLFPKEASAASVVKKLLSNFNTKTQGISSETELDQNQILTLASLIERETKKGNEREVVAGILLKRIDAGWPLQVDAAVQYAVATQRSGGKIIENWWPILTRDDLAINSPYNTYKFQGLPPAPIANPGLTAIKAAYNPQDSDYWYYIHDNSGVIHYAKTLEEHNQNIAKYLGK